ncbi:MAG: hypothetical protein J6N21_12260 [Butyrivibrio sp.]|nr:hypothetical protein [Butyrivibrio sp.]
MITNSTGTIIVDRELNLVEVQENYFDFCLRGKRNSFIDCVKPEDRYLLSDMIALFEKEEKASLCFRLLKKNGEYGWVMAFVIKIPMHHHLISKSVYGMCLLLKLRIKMKSLILAPVF